MTGQRLASVLAAAVVAAAVFFAFGRAAAAGTPTTPRQEVVADGQALYDISCVSCHGLGGVGSKEGPTLIGVGAAAADFYLTTGRMPLAVTGQQPPRKRPAFTRPQIDALVAYVASLGSGPAVPNVDTADADLARGGVLYRANCASCHNAAGIGGALSYGRHAPALSSATATQVVEAMRVGPGQMPVFDELTLTRTDANDIARYVEYLRDPHDRGGLSLGRSGPVGEGFVALLFGLGGLVVICVWVVGRHG